MGMSPQQGDFLIGQACLDQRLDKRCLVWPRQQRAWPGPGRVQGFRIEGQVAPPVGSGLPSPLDGQLDLCTGCDLAGERPSLGEAVQPD